MADWLAVAVESAAETATGALACEAAEQVGGVERLLPDDTAGAYVPIIAGNERLLVGLLSSDAGCQDLSRRLLGMEPEEVPSGDDVADAVGEIVNIVAGVVQRRVAGRMPVLELGLPFFIRGQVVASDKQEVAVAAMQLDGVRADLVLVRGHLNGHRVA